MANISTYDVIIDAPKSVLLMIVSNPAFVAGVLGHLSILEAYDPKQNKFVPPEELTSAPTKFKVAYIFGTPEGKVTMQLGEMEGPITYVDIISYKGFTYDNKMKWEMTFTFKEVSPGRTKVSIVSRTEEEKGLFSRFLGRNQFSLADHAIKAHIIPFIQLYMNQLMQLRTTVAQGSVEYRVLAEEEGVVSEILAKLMRVAKESNAEHAMIAIQGEGFKGKIVLKDGKPVESWFRFGDNSIKTGNDAIVEALSSTAKGKGWLYTVDVNSLVDSVFEQIFSGVTTKAVTKG